MLRNLNTARHDEFGQLDILFIDGKPYFPAKACAQILGYRDTVNAIKQHCKGVVKHHHPTNGGSQVTNFIPEGDLYRLIIRSKLPAAERFEAWVFEEVLPSIRKHGAYITADVLDSALGDPELALTLFRKLRDEQGRTNALMDRVEDLVPKARYCDTILQCSNAVPITLVAKDYGMSATAFNRLLHDLGIQYKIGTAWILYQKYAGNGYTRSRTYYIPGGVAVLHTCWTQKGRLFLYEFLRARCILPAMESGPIYH